MPSVGIGIDVGDGGLGAADAPQCGWTATHLCN